MEVRLIRELADSIERGEAVVLVTVVQTHRSVPRHAGSKMLIRADGTALGSIGGGEMEARVLREARAALGDVKPRLVHFDLVDPKRGDPGVCGGDVQLYLEPYMPNASVYVIGCGHVGRAVVDLAHWLGYRVIAFDDRPDQVTEELLPLADVRLHGSINEALASHPPTPDTHIVVLTRNMGLDLDIIPAVLSTPARSIGVMGSSRRWATTRAELEQRGVPAEQLDRVKSPIGIELQAETPEEIAVSVMAEIVGSRRGAL